MNLEDILPFGLTPDMLIVSMAGAAAFLSVLAVWYALIYRDPLAPRLKMLAERRAALKAGLTAPRRREKPKNRSIGMMCDVVTRLNLLRSRQAERMSLNLVRAGFRSKDVLVTFMFMKLATPLVLGAAALVLLYALDIYELSPMLKLAISVASIIFGAFAPNIYVKNAIDKRKHALRKGLPDALDLMVICAEAGLSMDAAFSRVSRELALSSPEMADEIGLTSIELSFLPERRKAIENLSNRTDMQEIRGVVNTLAQTEKYGTPLAQGLRVLANEFRNDRLMRAEEKAARLPATLTVPMVVFILPSLFVVLIGPAVIRTIDALSKM